MTTDETYNYFMQELAKRKTELNMSNNSIAKASGDTRLGVTKKLKSGNVHLKTFIALCHALKLNISLTKLQNND